MNLSDLDVGVVLFNVLPTPRNSIQMDQHLEQVAAYIRSRVPDIDIRTDQCEIVRVYCGMILIGIEQTVRGFRAKEVSLEGKTDFDTTLLSIVDRATPEEIAEDVVAMIERIRQSK